MSELFQTMKQNVSLHAKYIFEDGDLVENSVVKESLTAQIEGNGEVQRTLQFIFAGKRSTDFPVRWAKRITVWKTRAPLKKNLKEVGV